MLAEAGGDVLAFTPFQVLTGSRCVEDPLERLNKEIRRRTDTLGIFLNRSVIR